MRLPVPLLALLSLAMVGAVTPAVGSSTYWISETSPPYSVGGWRVAVEGSWLDPTASGDVLLQDISATMGETIAAVDINVAGSGYYRPATPLSFAIYRQAAGTAGATLLYGPFPDLAPSGDGVGQYGGPHQIGTGAISITIEPGYLYRVQITGESGEGASAGDLFFVTQRLTSPASAAYPN